MISFVKYMFIITITIFAKVKSQLPIANIAKNKPAIDYFDLFNKKTIDMFSEKSIDGKLSENVQFRSDESKLRSAIMNNYAADVRPVSLTTTITNVNISLSSIQIMELDAQNQVMVLSAQMLLKWQDEFLKWNPDEYNNQTKIVFTAKDIWTPDIVLFNSAEAAFSQQRDNYLLEVHYTGTVRWFFPDILRSYCPVDVKFFPFDSQNCILELQSWSRSKREIMVLNDDNDNDFLNQSNSFVLNRIHTEWKLINMTVVLREENDYVWLEYTLNLNRNPSFYVNHLIYPFTVLSSLTLFVFWLPPDSGEKITLTITILLALTVFLQLISEYTPKSSKSLPIIGVYFNVNLIFVLISVILTIIVLNFHFRGPKRRRVPKLMRKYIIGYLGKMFCFQAESKAYVKILNNDDFYKSNETNEMESKMKNNEKELFDLKSGFLLNKIQDDSNEEKLNINYFYEKLNDSLSTHLVLNGEMRLKLNESLLNSQQEEDAVYNKKKLKIESDEIKQKKALLKKLELLVQKLEKSFDPSEVKNDKLKYLILKEIAECQLNLLNSCKLFKNEALFERMETSSREEEKINTKNLNDKNSNKKLDMSQIYDEWRIIALIMDRTCFFLYLSFLVISSSLFIFSEKVKI